MNMKMMFLSLLSVVTLFSVECAKADEGREAAYDKNVSLRAKAENTPEFKELERFRKETEEKLAQQGDYREKCHEKKCKLACFSKECLMVWVMEPELFYRRHKDQWLAEKAVSTPEYKAWQTNTPLEIVEKK